MKKKRVVKNAVAGLAMALAVGNVLPMALPGVYGITAFAETVQGSLAITDASVKFEQTTGQDKATFDYTITMSVPDTVRDGDTVALQTRNMSDILDAGETSRVVMVDNVIVGRIERTGYFSKAARQAEVDETLVQKEKASLKAGYADCDYVITFNTNAAKARGKEISFSVNRTEPGTLVSKDADVTAEVKINRKSIFTTKLTIPAYKVSKALNVNKTTVSLDGNTEVLVSDNKLVGNNLELTLTPYGYSLEKGSRIRIKFPEHSMIRFVKNDSLKNEKYSAHTPRITADTKANDDNVFMQEYDRVKFDVAEISDNELVLELVAGHLKDNDNYVLDSKRIGVEIALTSYATNKLKDGTEGKVTANDVYDALIKSVPTDSDAEKLRAWFTDVKLWAEENGYNEIKNAAVDGIASLKKEDERVKAKDSTLKALKAVSDTLKGDVSGDVSGIKGTKIGPETAEIVLSDSKGDRKTAINNTFYVDIVGGTLDAKGIEHASERTVITRYVSDEDGSDIADPVENGEAPADKIEIEGYTYGKTERVGDKVTHYYHKQAVVPKGMKLTEYTDSYGLQIAKPDIATEAKPAKDINGYTFVRTEHLENGERHVYTAVARKEVLTHYMLYGTNEALVKSVESIDPAAQLDINGYVFMKRDIDSDGNVTYWYKRQDNAHVREVKTYWITEDGTQLKTAVTDVTMQAAGKIGGYIYVETKESEDKLTVQHIFKKDAAGDTSEGQVFTKYLDENGKELQGETHGEKAGDAVKISGYEYAGTKVVDKTHVEHVYKKLKVEEARDAKESNKETKARATEAETRVDGVKVNTKGDSTVSFETTSKELNTLHNVKGIIVTKFVDRDGKSIKDSIKDTKEHNYEFVEGYVFDHSEVDGNEVRHIYRKYDGDAFVTKFMDWNSDSEIYESKKARGSVAPLQFEGYIYKKTTGNTTDGFVHYYVKGSDSDRTTLTNVTKNSEVKDGKAKDVTTYYEDKDGKRIADTVRDSARGKKKEIDGYKYLRTEESSDGKTVTFVYEKVSEYTIEFVDTDNRRIKDSKKSDDKTKHDDIDGYTYVGTKVEGDTVRHIYRKNDATKGVTVTNNNANGNAQNADVKPDVKPDEKPYIKTGADAVQGSAGVIASIFGLLGAGGFGIFGLKKKKDNE